MMYCSLCGDEISKDVDKFYLEVDKIVCPECYNELHLMKREKRMCEILKKSFNRNRKK